MQKIEFLGAFCLVTVSLAAAPAQPLIVNLSRQSLDRMSLRGRRAVVGRACRANACASLTAEVDVRVIDR